jgi:hypothetical protein
VATLIRIKIEIAVLCHAEHSEASLLTKPLKGEIHILIKREPDFEPCVKELNHITCPPTIRRLVNVYGRRGHISAHKKGT